MAGGANRAWTDEATLTDPKRDGDPRIVLLRNDCPRCNARRGQYCRTSGGYTTLHKARGKRPVGRVSKEGRAVPQRPVSSSPDAQTVERVWERDKGRCVPCGEQLYWQARGHQWSVSHRKLRAQGGDNRMSNLMLSCGNGTTGCEGDIHANPKKAQDAGWMVRRDADPAEVALWCARRGHGRLTDDGGWTKLPEGGA